MDERGTNFALLAIVALVAVVALVILLKAQAVPQQSIDSSNSNLVGNAKNIDCGTCAHACRTTESTEVCAFCRDNGCAL